MTTITLPEAITLRHGGAMKSIPTADIPESALLMLFQYGVTRKPNDMLNGEKKKVTDEGHEWDAESELASWTQNLMDGKIGTSTRGDAVEKFLRRIVAGLIVKKTGMDAKAATTKVKSGALAAFEDVFSPNPDAWAKILTTAKDQVRVEQEAREKLAALTGDIDIS